MPRTYEDPVLTEDASPMGGTRETHPSYGQISASRVTGDQCLYGSDFVHHNHIRIRITHSDMHRSLSRDWPFARKELIEVALSEAQWATFVSSLNIGSGPCCTLQAINNVPIPQIPEPVKRTQQFTSEVDEKLVGVREKIKTLEEAVNNLTASEKAKKPLRDILHMLTLDVGANLEFVAKSFGEHVENITEAAKIEVNAHINSVIARAGLKALGSPLALGTPEEPTDDQ